MIRNFIKYILFLYVLLLSFTSLVYAHPQESHVYNSQSSNQEDSNVCSTDSQNFNLGSATSNSEKEKHNIEDIEIEEEEEEEEDKNHALSKTLDCNSSYAFLTRNYFRYIKKSLSLRTHFWDLISSNPVRYLFIQYEVYRI